MEEYIFYHDSSIGFREGKSPYDLGFAFHVRSDDRGRWVHRSDNFTHTMPKCVLQSDELAAIAFYNYKIPKWYKLGIPNESKTRGFLLFHESDGKSTRGLWISPSVTIYILLHLKVLNNSNDAFESTDQVYSFLEEFVWTTWSDLHRKDAGRADGHTVT